MGDPPVIDPFADIDIKEKSKSTKSSKNGPSVPELHGFYLERVAPEDGSQLSWRRVDVRQLPYTQEELEEEGAKCETAPEAFPDLTTDQQGVINRLVEQKQAKEKGDDVQWTVDGIQAFHFEKRRKVRWPRKKETETERLLVILKRGKKIATPPPGKQDAKSSSKTPASENPMVIDLCDPPPVKKSKRDKSKNKDPVDPFSDPLNWGSSTPIPPPPGMEQLSSNPFHQPPQAPYPPNWPPPPAHGYPAGPVPVANTFGGYHQPNPFDAYGQTLSNPYPGAAAPDTLKQSIRFKDAVGRKFSFPFHICKTWKGMEGLIKQAFLHVDVIGEQVQQGHYDLTGPDGEIILPQVWDTIIQPDWEVSMYMWPMPDPEDRSAFAPPYRETSRERWSRSRSRSRTPPRRYQRDRDAPRSRRRQLSPRYDASSSGVSTGVSGSSRRTTETQDSGYYSNPRSSARGRSPDTSVYSDDYDWSRARKSTYARRPYPPRRSSYSFDTTDSRDDDFPRRSRASREDSYSSRHDFTPRPSSRYRSSYYRDGETRHLPEPARSARATFDRYEDDYYDIRRPASPRRSQRRPFIFDDYPDGGYPIVPREPKSSEKPKARFDDPLVRTGPEITEMSESVQDSDVRPAPSSSAGEHAAHTSEITKTQNIKDLDVRAQQDKPAEGSSQVTVPEQRRASSEGLAQEGQMIGPESNSMSTDQHEVPDESTANEETAAVGSIDSAASPPPHKMSIESAPEAKTVQTSERPVNESEKPAVSQSDPVPQRTDPTPSAAINRDSFLDGFASRCLQNLGRESARAWFEFDEAVEGVEQLLELFALMMHRGSKNDPSLEPVYALVSQNVAAIAERLRDLAFKGDEHALPQPSQPESDSIVEWLFTDSAKRHERGTIGKGASQQSVNEESSLGHVTVTLNFHWLMERMEKLSTLSETGSQFASTRAVLASRICEMRASDSLMMALDWDPMAFMEQQFASDRRDICQTIVYCGVARAAYACTAAEYVKTVWPHAGPDAIECMRDACNSNFRSSKRTIQGVNVEIRLASGKAFVCIAANDQAANEALEIAEVCVWLATACRANTKDGNQAYCATQLELVSDPETGFDLLQANTTFDDIDSERLATMGSCWLKMVNNPVIAQGYPIPMRSDPSQQQGLEASLDLMVSLAHAAWATVFGATFLLKGMVSALLPIFELEKSLVWHFIVSEDGDRLTYDDLCTRSVTPQPILLTPDDLQDRRHFIGLWSPAVRIAAGINDNKLYSGLKLSNSKKLDHYTGTLSNLSCSLGKFINIGAGFTIGKKDTSAALRASESRPFETKVGHASHMNVVFYGTQDRRGWLLDGASALMHLARLWMTCDGNGSEHMEQDALKKLCYRDSQGGQGGRQAAVATLVENKNRDIGIFTNTRRQDEESTTVESTPRKSSGSSSSESGYDSHHSSRASKWKRESKRTTSDWTFERLVVELWQILEAMHDKLYLSKIHAPEVTMKTPSSKPTLAGWETLDILKNRGPFEPRGVEMRQGAGQWIEWARETSSIVLLARTFDELIVPVKQAGGCSRTLEVPTRKDLLAVPLYIWRSTSERWMYDDEDCSKGCVRISDESYWHTFQPAISACSGEGPCTCDTVSKLGKKPVYANKKLRSSIASVNVFKKYQHGAAIIGDLKERVSFIASLQTSTVLQQVNERAPPGLGIHTRNRSSSHRRSDYAAPSASSDKSTTVSRWNSTLSSPFTGARSSETEYSGSEWQRPPSYKSHRTRASSSAVESVPDIDEPQEYSHRGSSEGHRDSEFQQRPRIRFEDDPTPINGLAAAAESASALYDRPERDADDLPPLPLLSSPWQSGKFNAITNPHVSAEEVGSEPESLASIRTRGSLRRVSKASWGADGLKSMFRNQSPQQ